MATVPGLLRPIQGVKVEQPFDGVFPWEPAGYLGHDHLRARLVWFKNASRLNHLHMAEDLAAPVGTAVRAPEKGIVVGMGTIWRFADGSPDGERYMLLQIHRDATYQTVLLFTHLYQFRANDGDHVEQGEVIATSGRSGRVTGPHLHWEVRVGPRADSPLASWGSRWTRWNPAKCLEGQELAKRSFLIPNV